MEAHTKKAAYSTHVTSPDMAHVKQLEACVCSLSHSHTLSHPPSSSSSPSLCLTPKLLMKERRPA